MKRLKLKIGLIFTVHMLALWLFKDGFLLTRTVIPRPDDHMVKEMVDDVAFFPSTLTDSMRSIIQAHSDSYKKPKVIIILIDALRFDFAAHQPNSSSVYHNRLGAIDDKLRREPRNSHLFHFIADPPTTTMQRLKALMTGSLPTFVDAGDNFASGKVLDDHVLRQMNRAGKRIVFMGDDTWLSLYEREIFHQAFPFPSFEVFDLHTVDQGCLDNIGRFVSMDRDNAGAVDGDWDMLVAHFLGVDHAGHRFGPDHREMDSKLRQLDVFLEDLFASIDIQTTVLVIGDHGMNNNGDHGGDSNAELDAACFVYSKSKLFHESVFSQNSVSLPMAGQSHNDSCLWTDLHIAMEAVQIGQISTVPIFDKRYPTIYQIDIVPTLASLLGFDIPFGNLGMVVPQFIMPDFLELGGDHLHSILYLLDKIKANFDQVYAFITVYNQATGEMGNVKRFLDESVANMTRQIAFMETDLSFGCISMLECTSTQLEDIKNRCIQIVVLIMKALRLSLELCRDEWARFDKRKMILGIILLAFTSFWVLAAISTSYLSLVVRHKEDCAAIAIGIILHASIFSSNSFVVFEDSAVFYLLQTGIASMLLSYKFPNQVAVASLMLVISRISFLSTVCREEQLPRCAPTFANFPMSTFPFAIFDDMNKRDISISGFTMFSLAAVTALLPAALTSLMKIPARGGRIISRRITSVFVCIFAHWMFEALEERSPIFGLALETLRMCKVWSARGSYLIIALSFIGDFVKKGQIDRELHNILTSLNFFMLVATVELPAGVLNVGFGYLQYMLLLFHIGDSPRVIHPIVVILIGKQQFFATGHQAAFSSIQFQTSFIGLESFHFIVSGGIVTLNSIGPTMIFVVGLGTILHKLKLKDRLLCELAIWGTILYYVSITLSSIVFTALFRRHLMVWNVFAPRFMLASIELMMFEVILLLLI